MRQLANRYKFVVKEIEIEDIYKQQIQKERVVAIGLKNLQTGVILPHPLTNFIRKKYRFVGKSLSTQRNPAFEICKFMNFIYKQIDEGDTDFIDLVDRGLRGLKPIHFSKYLTYKTREGLKYNTIKMIERYLVSFLEFLIEQDLIDEKIELKYKKDKYGNHYLVSPFRHSTLDTQFPKQRTNANVEDKLRDFGKNRYTLTKEFINLARIKYPEIALGICFQFFGGLRRGEVVNLTTTSVKTKGKWGENGFILEIRDNKDKLFQHIKNTDKEEVKNPRNQTLLVNHLLSEVYKEHMSRLSTMKIKGRVKNHLALFVSFRTGLAISGATYEQKFNRLREEFIDMLLQSGRYDDYQYLNTSWNTHIGRGVFTNFLLDLGLTPTQIAIARGDKSIQSALSYVEEKNAIENIESALQEISQAYKEGNANIDTQKVVSWKEVFSNAGRIDF